VVNDELDRTVDEMLSIIARERTVRRRAFVSPNDDD
jgi:hypothetical protein